MSKIKPNNLGPALKSAEAYEESNGQKPGTLTSRIPNEILAKDGKNHFHVLLIKKRHDRANQRYVTSGSVQTFGKGPAFEKMEKNFRTQGVSAMIVIHDPTKDAPKVEATVPAHEVNAVDRKIEAEEQKAMQDRIAERKAEAKNVLKEKAEVTANNEATKKSEANKGQATGPKLVYDGREVTEENIDDFIKDNKVDASKAKTPEGKLAIVTEWIEKQTKK